MVRNKSCHAIIFRGDFLHCLETDLRIATLHVPTLALAAVNSAQARMRHTRLRHCPEGAPTLTNERNWRCNFQTICKWVFNIFQQRRVPFSLLFDRFWSGNRAPSCRTWKPDKSKPIKGATASSRLKNNALSSEQSFHCELPRRTNDAFTVRLLLLLRLVASEFESLKENRNLSSRGCWTPSQPLAVHWRHNSERLKHEW